MLEGDRVVTATAYTILKLHATKLLKFKDMDTITDYLQVKKRAIVHALVPFSIVVRLSFSSQYKLQKNFGFSDNYFVKSLEASMAELRAKRMDLPPPAGDNELPQNEMGKFVEPTIEKQLGLRSACFSDPEKNVTEFVISRTEENGNDVDTLDEHQDDTISNINTGKRHASSRRLITG